MPLTVSVGKVWCRCGLSIAWLALSGSALAQDLWLAGDWAFTASQLRRSSFVDGAFLADPRSRLVHSEGVPKALSESTVQASWSPTRWPGWELEIFGKQETRISGVPGSLSAVAQFNGRHEPLGAAVQLPFAVTSQSMRRWGLGLSKRISTALPDGVEARIGGKVFAVDQYRAVDADGILTESLGGDLGLQAQVEDRKLGGDSIYIHPGRSLGHGLSADVSLRWGERHGTHAFFAATDVGPPVHLQHVLRTSTQANSSRVSYDANGYVQFAPMVSGRFSDEGAQVKQYAHFALGGGYQLAPATVLLAQLESSHPIQQFGIGLSWGNPDLTVRSLLHVGAQLPSSLELTFRTTHLDFSWRGDAFSPSQARVWGILCRLKF